MPSPFQVVVLARAARASAMVVAGDGYGSLCIDVLLERFADQQRALYLLALRADHLWVVGVVDGAFPATCSFEVSYCVSDFCLERRDDLRVFAGIVLQSFRVLLAFRPLFGQSLFDHVCVCFGVPLLGAFSLDDFREALEDLLRYLQRAL